MRILYIHQHFCTPDGGSGIRSYMFSRHFIAQGHHVRMLCGSTHMRGHKALPRGRFVSRADVDGIEVLRLGAPYSNRMGYGLRMFSFALFTVLSVVAGLFSKGLDVVYATSTPLTVGLAGYIVARVKRIPFVFEVRDLWPEAAIQVGALKNPLLIKAARALEKFLYRRSRSIIALSPGMTTGVIETGIPAGKVQTIPNGCDLALFKPSQADPGFLGKWGLEGKFVVAYIGAVGYSNDLDFLLSAARILKGTRDDIVFFVAGDGKALPALKERVALEGLTRVILAGKLPHDQIPGVLAASSVTATCFRDLPILSTNSPNKLFDSLAAARPVIVNSPGWTRKLLEEAGAGLYVRAGRPEELAAMLERLADEPIRCRTMGLAARRLAEERFDRNKLAAQALTVLEEAAGIRRYKVA